MFRPRSAGLLLAVVTFPVLAAVAVLLGVVAVLELSPLLGAALFVLCLMLALLPLLVLAVVLRGWFTLQVDDEGLTLIGVLGTGPLRLRWADQEAVGLASWRGQRMLAVRPVTPLRRSPKRALVWDDETGLLLVAGLDNWSAPRDEVVAAVREYAELWWSDRLDSPDALRRTT